MPRCAFANGVLKTILTYNVSIRVQSHYLHPDLECRMQPNVKGDHTNYDDWHKQNPLLLLVRHSGIASLLIFARLFPMLPFPCLPLALLSLTILLELKCTSIKVTIRFRLVKIN